MQLVGEWVHAGLLESGPSGFRLRPGSRPQVPRDALALWSARIENLLDENYAEVNGYPQLGLGAYFGVEMKF